MREQAEGGIDRARHISTLDVMLDEAAEGGDRSLPQSIPFAPEPGVEWRLVHDEALQEVARVQFRRPPDGVRREVLAVTSTTTVRCSASRTR